MFKIVQTTERGKSELSIVPKAWEKKGSLYWPKKQADKLIAIENSVPESNWFQMNCTLKRENLTRENAERELTEMLLHDDTDNKQPSPPPKKKRPRVLLPKQQQSINFNSLAESYNKNNVQMARSSPPLSSLQILSVEQSSAAPASSQAFYTSVGASPTILDSFQIGHIPELQIENLPLPEEQLLKILHTQDVIFQNQNKVLTNQNILIKKMSELDVFLENFLKKFESIHISNIKQQHLIVASAPSTNFEAVDSAEAINSLEKKLQNEEFMNELVDKLSVICGKSGKEYGLNVCYTLIDILFTREFMTACSWAGGSRTQKEKIPFKVYKQVILLFFTVVRLADNHFTLENCEDFFKNILKNSTRRNETKKSMRRSKCKRRPKKLSYNSAQLELFKNEDITSRNNNDGNGVNGKCDRMKESLLANMSGDDEYSSEINEEINELSEHYNESDNDEI